LTHAGNKVIALMGPTASGKTGLAARLVQEFPLEIISVDSALVYRGMDIGTAKPDTELLKLAPHRLIDLCQPWETYSAAQFARDAVAAVAEIRAAGNIPLLVGGTMLYFQALEQGLSPLPGAHAGVRDELAARAREQGWAVLYEQLQQIDPVAAKRIHPNDRQRIQRALEVYQVSGRTLTELQGAAEPALGNSQWLKLVISPADRKVLHRRIEQRFEQMLNSGLVAELENLRKDPRLLAELPAMRSVGYRQAWQFLEGEFDQQELLARGIYASRQLAKRQLTWLRRMPDTQWLDPQDPAFEDQIEATIRQFLTDTL
jgi:tRNA dimethylallyltransferase